jgi:hypothetical protein
MVLFISLLVFTDCGGGGGGSHKTHPPQGDPLDNWHWRNPLPQGNPLYGVTYGNGIYVAVGSNGTIVTSADGITWTSRTSDTSYSLSEVAYGNGTFVVVGGWTILQSDPVK